MPQHNWPKVNDAQSGFCPCRSTAHQIVPLQQSFEKSLEYATNVHTCYVDVEKAYDRVPCEKLSGVLRECGVDGRLLLGVKSLRSWSEVCVDVGRVKSRQFTVVVGLRQGCVLSPLLFIVYMNGIDSHSRVEEGAKAVSCRINRLLFADDLVLLASCQHESSACTRFLLRATEPEWKSTLKIPRHCVSLGSVCLERHCVSLGSVCLEGSVCCKWATMHCSRWRNSST